MTAADLIAALQRLPQHLPVKVLLGTFNDADGSIFYLHEGDALPVDTPASEYFFQNNLRSTSWLAYHAGSGQPTQALPC